MSENAGTGSHLAVAPVTDADGVHIGGSGSSGNAENGSHPAAADFSNEPGAVLWRHTPPRRTESGILSYGTAPLDRAVQKMAPVAYARLILAPGPHAAAATARSSCRVAGASGSWWRIVVAQVRRKSMMARWLQSRCDTKPDSTGGG